MGFDINLSELKKILKPKKIANVSDDIFSGVSINSKEVKKKNIFVALRGANKDGHEFISEAMQNEAALNIVDRDINHYPYLMVDDTNTALKKLAEWHREKSNADIFAVVGSAGKTTTKEILSSILSTKTTVHKTYINENNWIGVSKTLLNLKPHHRVCIVECGTNHAGEIKDISNVLKPDGVIFTNIGITHIGNFESADRLIEEKLSILNSTKGKLIAYNLDDKNLQKIKNGNFVSFSLCNPEADVYIKSYEKKKDMLYFDIAVFSERIKINIKDKLVNPYNILAAAAFSKSYIPNISQSDIETGINSAQLQPYRMQKEHIDKVNFILDCYNSNPDSLKYAAEVAAGMSGRKLYIIGDMLELGSMSKQLHKESGKFLLNFDIDIIGYGNDARYIVDIFKNRSKHYAEFFDSFDRMMSEISNIYHKYSVVLIKGSRSLKMENIFYALGGGR